MAKDFNTNLYNAMEVEKDTETLSEQLDSFKCIINEAGPGLMNAEEVQHIADKAIEIVGKSLLRIEDNNKLPGEHDEQFEDEDD